MKADGIHMLAAVGYETSHLPLIL